MRSWSRALGADVRRGWKPRPGPILEPATVDRSVATVHSAKKERREECVREEGGRINSPLSKPLASLRAMRKKPRLPSIVAGVHIVNTNKENKTCC